MKLSSFALVCVLLFWWTVSGSASQLQLAPVDGAVIAPDGTRLDDVVVSVLDTLGEYVTSTTTMQGTFRFQLVPGTYVLSVDAGGLSVRRTLVVRDALPIAIELRPTARTAEDVVVSAEPGEVTPVHGVTIGTDAIRGAPMRLRGRGLQDIVATAPGWATEDNGLLHVRGVDDGFLYVVDGVPVYERLDSQFGQAPDPATIDSVNVLTGYIPPEFGFKSGGVIEVRSASRGSDQIAATTDVVLGNDRLREGSAVVGLPLSDGMGLTLATAAQGSSRFLDPVHPDNLHNDGSSISGNGQFQWDLSPSGNLSVVAGATRAAFDAPHGEEQEEAGQDQRQRVANVWQSASWQHGWSASTVTQLAGYHRDSRSLLRGSEHDTPLFTEADRDLRRVGVLASVTHQRGRHLFKLGGEASWLSLDEQFHFAVTDPEGAEDADISDSAAEFTLDAPFVFEGSARPMLLSAYLQDSIRASARLTLDVGVRLDHSALLIAATQLSPRVGVAYQWPETDTTLRASVGRFFQPPQPENLLLSSSPEARALSPFADGEGGGGSELPPERQTAFDVGVTQGLRRVRVDASYWRRWVRDAADPNVFFGTTIIFPNSVARGRASGFEVRVDVPRQRGWSAYGSYAHARVTQFGPVTGGLFLEDEVIEISDGTAFTPDHDQRHVSAFGVAHDVARARLSWSLSGRYESGTPLEVDLDELDELLERPGIELVDLQAGRVRPRTVLDAAVSHRLMAGERVDLELRAALLNLTGERWAYNFSNPFSGTHFGPGRTAQIGLRAFFR